ncbi:MAG: UPF0147 family protein [Nitrososphaeria archaeon]
MSLINRENQDRANKAIVVLQNVSESVTVPRNIRKTIKEIILDLQKGKDKLGVRAANAVAILTEISEDPNLPIFARVKIYDAISCLENIRD